MINELCCVLGEISELEKEYKKKKQELREKAKKIVIDYKGEITQELIDFYYWESGLPTAILERKLDSNKSLAKLARPCKIKIPCGTCGDDVIVKGKSRSELINLRYLSKFTLCESCKRKKNEKEPRKRNSLKLYNKSKNFTEIERLNNLTYQEYIETPYWDNTRKRALKAAGYRCQKCRKVNVPLDVHHLTYERRGQELLSDLLVVCRPCHEAIHGKKFSSKKTDK